MRDVKAEREKLLNFVRDVHEGRITGHTGKKFEAVINIGIGGSDLGPVMAVEALARFRARGLEMHFCVERRRLSACRRDCEHESGDNACHRLLEDLYDTRNNVECTTGTSLDCRASRRGCVAKTFRCGVRQPACDGRIRRRPCAAFCDVGLGRWAVFGVVFNRSIARAGCWYERTSRRSSTAVG